MRDMIAGFLPEAMGSFQRLQLLLNVELEMPGLCLQIAAEIARDRSRCTVVVGIHIRDCVVTDCTIRIGFTIQERVLNPFLRVGRCQSIDHVIEFKLRRDRIKQRRAKLRKASKSQGTKKAKRKLTRPQVRKAQLYALNRKRAQRKAELGRKALRKQSKRRARP